jgi:hypothetical protein
MDSSEPPPPQPQRIILDDRFMGVKDPMWELNKEQPWHRWAAYGLALGDNLKSIARKLGKSEPAVQNLLRQPWFQAMVNKLMAELGGRDIMQMFQSESFNSLVTLIELRDNPRVPAHARMQCAKDILDRALGKPVQRVETTTMPSSDDPVAEVERLELEVNRLRRDTSSASTSRGASYEQSEATSSYEQDRL